MSIDQMPKKIRRIRLFLDKKSPSLEAVDYSRRVLMPDWRFCPIGCTFAFLCKERGNNCSKGEHPNWVMHFVLAKYIPNRDTDFIGTSINPLFSSCVIGRHQPFYIEGPLVSVSSMYLYRVALTYVIDRSNTSFIGQGINRPNDESTSSE